MKFLEENIKEAKICMSLDMGQTDSVHLGEETVGFIRYISNLKVTNLYLLCLIKIPGYFVGENKNPPIIYSFLAVIIFFLNSGISRDREGTQRCFLLSTKFGSILNINVSQYL